MTGDDMTNAADHPPGAQAKSSDSSTLLLVSLTMALFALVVGVTALVMQLSKPAFDVSTAMQSQVSVAKLEASVQALEARLNAVALLAETATSAGDEGNKGNGVSGSQVSPGEIAAIRDDVAQLREAVTQSMISAAQVQAMAQGAGTGGGQDTTLSPRVVALEQALATLSQAGIATPASVTDVRERAEGAHRRLDAITLESQQSTTAVDARLAALVADMPDQIRDQLAPLAQQTAGTQNALGSLDAQVQGLTAQTQALESAIAAQSEQSAASSARLLAVSRLRDALIQGRGVQAEAQAVRLVTSGDQILDQVLPTLDPVTATSVPSVDTLAQRFPRLWEELSLAAQLAENQDNQLGQLWARARSLVNIQRVDGEAAILAMAGVEGHLARANFFLNQGRLDDSLTALAMIEGDLALPLASFKSDLANRLAYEDVLVELERWSLARLATQVDQIVQEDQVNQTDQVVQEAN